jgi:hypothetical protein
MYVEQGQNRVCTYLSYCHVPGMAVGVGVDVAVDVGTVGAPQPSYHIMCGAACNMMIWKPCHSRLRGSQGVSVGFVVPVSSGPVRSE